MSLAVGLTGSLAAGKTTVGRMLEAHGAVRIDADELAREAVRPGSAALEEIRDIWGDGILADDGSLDRSTMRSVVFGDPEARSRLERIVHGEVHALRRRRHAEAEHQGARIVVDEIPLLYELGLEDRFDAVVVVDAPLELRCARAMEARGWTAAEFAAIEASQLPAAEKVARADHVIRNDGDETDLARATGELWRALERRAEAEEDPARSRPTADAG